MDGFQTGLRTGHLTRASEPVQRILMPRLTNVQRRIALGMLRSGIPVRRIAREMGCSQVAIHNLRERSHATGPLGDRLRSGRPRVTSENQDQRIRLIHLRDRWRTATMTSREIIGTHGRQVNPVTIRRRLRAAGLAARRPYRGPILRPHIRRERLQWSRIHQRWTMGRWRGVLFTDESRFCLSVADGRCRVWRRRGERYADACVMERDRWGGAAVMVWAGISSTLRTELVFIQGTLTAQRYIDEVLTPHVVPLFNAHPFLHSFQQDNARPHVARVTREFLEEQDFHIMRWTPYSPDLSPIEHLWDELGRRLQQRQPQNREQLVRFLREEWEAIPQGTISNLVQSMRRRCTACINARGGHTRD